VVSDLSLLLGRLAFKSIDAANLLLSVLCAIHFHFQLILCLRSVLLAEILPTDREYRAARIHISHLIVPI
jgi:hypothetical protein